MQSRSAALQWACALGFATVTSCPEAHAFEALGLMDPAGQAYFVKRFEVEVGTVVDAIEFVSNDDRVVFPRVAILQGPAKRLADAQTLWETRNARTTSAHRVRVACPRIRLDADRDVFVAIQLPPTDGVRGVADGAGLGALPVARPNGSFIAASTESPLVDLAFDLAISIQAGVAGKASTTGPESAALTLATRNPVPGIADVRFGNPRPGRVSLIIYDVGGREVRRLVQENVSAGLHSRTWDGRDSRGLAVVSGIYIVKLLVDGEPEVTQKLVLLR